MGGSSKKGCLGGFEYWRKEANVTSIGNLNSNFMPIWVVIL